MCEKAGHHSPELGKKCPENSRGAGKWGSKWQADTHRGSFCITFWVRYAAAHAAHARELKFPKKASRRSCGVEYKIYLATKRDI